MKTVFLGGTAAKSTWRDELITLLDATKVSTFNPVVDNWNEAAQKIEDEHKAKDDICLYVFTPESLASPQRGLYTISEVTDDSAKRGNKVVFAYVNYGGLEFTEGELKGLKAVAKNVNNNGGAVLLSLEQVADFLNA